MNLLSNALKFTRSGYVALSIEIINGKLIVKVEDTGCGLDPDFIPRMWDPYQQGEVRGTQRGTGLGLSIIKELLQKMQGTIEVTSQFRSEDAESSVRSGSIFTITLPLQLTSALLEPLTTQIKPRIAILVQAEESVYADGLQITWEKFGYHVHLVSKFSDLPNLEWKYVWADLTFLKRNMEQYKQLMQRNELVVLVPSNSHDSFSSLPGIQTSSHFVVLQKPLTWHLFEKRVQSAQERPAAAIPAKTLRFAPEVEVMDDSPKEHKERPRLPRKTSRKAVVLIVEDNPVCSIINHSFLYLPTNNPFRSIKSWARKCSQH